MVQIEMDKAGYDVEWNVLDSAEVVPQHRERIFIVGHLRTARTRKVFPIVRENGETNKTIEEVARIYPNRHSSEENSILDPSGIAPTLSTMQGGGQEPNILDDNGHKDYKFKPLDIVPTLRSQSHGNEPKVAIPVLTPERLHKRQNGRRFKTNGEPMFTLNTQDRHGVDDGINIRKLTPRECWRLQGFPDWAFDRVRQAGLSDSQLYKQAGNSVTVPVIKAIAERLGN